MSVIDDLKDWYDTNLAGTVNDVYGAFEDFSSSPAGNTILAYLMKDLSNSDVTRAGFQGKIEDRKAVQSRVADTADPFRRPGSSGRRYFSDVEFVKDKDDNVAQAKARTDAQAEALRIENRDNPFAPVATAYRLQQSAPEGTYDTTARATNRGIFSGYNPYGETAGVGLGLGALPFADPAVAEATAGAQASQLAIADANQQGSQMALPYASGGMAGYMPKGYNYDFALPVDPPLKKDMPEPEIDYAVNPNPNQVFSDADYADAGPPPRVDRVVKPDESYFDDRIKEIENRNQPNITPEQEQAVRAMNQARFTGGFRPQGLPSLPKRPPAMPEVPQPNIPIYPMVAGPDGVATHSNIPHYRHPDGTLKKYPPGAEDPGHDKPLPKVPPFKITPEQEQAVRAMNQARFSGFRKPPHMEPIDIPYMDRPDPNNPERFTPVRNPQPRQTYAMGGGVMQLAGGRYLDGMTDGMADEVPSSIGGVQPAALSDGEFVIPADVVSHLGNGSSNAGAKVLDDMMSNVRKERTGNPEQGKQINPKQVMAEGGIAGFANGGLSSLVNSKGPVRNFSGNEFGVDVGEQTGSESSLSNWAGSEVVDALGDAGGLRDKDYEAYTGPLTAGESDLQSDAFEAASDIDTSGFGDLDEEGVQDLMNPYMDAALDPQIRAEQERAAIQRRDNAARMAQAGSFGGSRQAILDAMGQRDSAQTQADIRARGYSDAFTQARDQFGKDRQFGLDALQKQADLGATQREIEAEGIAADKAQFDEERLYPYKNLSWYMSLLSGLPLEAQNTNFAEASDFTKYMKTLDYLGEEGGLNFLKTQMAVDYDTVAGDTLANLASKYGMSEADLLMLNPTITDPTAAIDAGTTIKVNRGKI